jgi:hypothetical protein
MASRIVFVVSPKACRMRWGSVIAVSVPVPTPASRSGSGSKIFVPVRKL